MRVRGEVLGGLASTALFSALACSTHLTLQMVSSAPPDFSRVMEGGRRIGLVVIAPRGLSDKEERRFTGTVQRQAQRAFSKYKYYRIVDIAVARKSLVELARSARDPRKTHREVARRFKLDGLVYLETPAKTKDECGVKTVLYTRKFCESYGFRSKSMTVGGRRIKTGGRERYCREYVKKKVKRKRLVASVFIAMNGRLVNLKTGRSLRANYAKAARRMRYAAASTALCPGMLRSAFGTSAWRAVRGLSADLSPRSNLFKVVVDDDPLGSAANENKVAELLRRGIERALDTPPDMVVARKSWQRALAASGGKSVHAHWNLALYYWSIGDIKQARFHFQRAHQFTGKALTKKRLELLSLFQAQHRPLKRALRLRR